MSVSLKKGERVSLEKVAPGLKAVFVGLGWDVKATDTGYDFDLDASAFILGADEKLISDQHFIFYNNLTSPDADQSVKHMGDNLTGEGEGDDEAILIDLRKLPENIQKIVFTVTIYEPEKRGQNFGQVENSFVRLVDVESKQEIIRYDLGEDYSIETAMILGELYRKNGEWRFSAVGAGYQGGLQALLNRYQN